MLNANALVLHTADMQPTETNSLQPTPEATAPNRDGRITVNEIAKRLDIGRLAVYQMLETGELPGIRLGRRWIVTRQAFEQWERTCGIQRSRGFEGKPEVDVVN